MMPPRYDDPGTRQFIVAAPASDHEVGRRGLIADSSQTPSLQMEWSATSRFGAFPRPGGYSVEAFIVADDLGLASWSPAAGAHVGLNVGVNFFQSDLPTACPQAQYVLRGCPSDAGNTGCRRPFQNVETFCQPGLAP